MDDRGFTLIRTIGTLERWERPATDEEAAPAIAQMQQADTSELFTPDTIVEARSLLRVVELRKTDGTVVRGPYLRRALTEKEQALVEDARERIQEAKTRQDEAAERQAQREAERARMLEERQLPADWGFDGDEGLSSHSGPMFFDAVDGYTLNQLSADDANTIARFAFARSSFLFDLAEKGEPVTFSPHELFAIANGFETIGFNLGDGVAFDFADEPVWPRHYRSFCDCVPNEDRAEMRKSGQVAGAAGCPDCGGSGVRLEPLVPADSNS